jgi:hypothetical protein
VCQNAFLPFPFYIRKQQWDLPLLCNVGIQISFYQISYSIQAGMANNNQEHPAKRAKGDGRKNKKIASLS